MTKKTKEPAPPYISDSERNLGIVISALQRALNAIEDARVWLKVEIPDTSDVFYDVFDNLQDGIQDAKAGVEALRSGSHDGDYNRT